MCSVQSGRGVLTPADIWLNSGSEVALSRQSKGWSDFRFPFRNMFGRCQIKLGNGLREGRENMDPALEN